MSIRLAWRLGDVTAGVYSAHILLVTALLLHAHALHRLCSKQATSHTCETRFACMASRLQAEPVTVTMYSKQRVCFMPQAGSLRAERP